MAHPYAHKLQGGACAGRRYGGAVHRESGGEVKQFPISLAQADNNRMKFERGVSLVSKKYGMSPDELRGRMNREYSAPVLRMPGTPE